MKLYIRLIIFLPFIFGSCRKDVHYYLTDEAEEFLLYEEGDTFKLRDELTGDVLTFTVESKVFTFVESGPQISHFSFGPTGDIFEQKGILTFSAPNSCYGEITVQANNSTDFYAYISLYGCNDDKHYELGGFNESDPYQIGFSNYYMFSGWPGTLFFSKTQGILRIEEIPGIAAFTYVN